MKTKTIDSIFPAALLAMLLAAGCSKQASDSQTTGADSEQLPSASQKSTSETDKTCETILKSPNTSDAREWVKQNPKSVFSVAGEDGNVMLAPTVARLYQAGAERIVIQHTPAGWLSAMVVALPAEPAARKKLFALDVELSQLREQTPVRDSGQRYLYYGFR
jgi:hypothetical protein